MFREEWVPPSRRADSSQVYIEETDIDVCWRERAPLENWGGGLDPTGAARQYYVARHTYMYSDLNLEFSSTMAVHSACRIIFISVSRTDLWMAAVRYDAEETRWWGADN